MDTDNKYKIVLYANGSEHTAIVSGGNFQDAANQAEHLVQSFALEDDFKLIIERCIEASCEGFYDD